MNGNGLSSLELSPFRLMPSWGCSSGAFRNQHVRNWWSPGAEGAAALQSQACLILEHSLSCMPWCLMLKQIHSFLPLLIPISTEHTCLVILFLGKPDHADVPCKEWFHITKLSKHSIFLSLRFAYKQHASWPALLQGQRWEKKVQGRSGWGAGGWHMMKGRWARSRTAEGWDGVRVVRAVSKLDASIFCFY